MIGTILIATIGYGLASFIAGLAFFGLVYGAFSEKVNSRDFQYGAFGGAVMLIVALAMTATTRWLLGGAL